MSTREEIRTGRRVRNGRVQVLVPADEPEKLTDTWRTPAWLVVELELRAGRSFDLDAAATAENSVAPFHIDRARDALNERPWSCYGPASVMGGRLSLGRTAIFCNPPFSKLGAFVRRCIDEVLLGGHTIALITLADISTAYWRLLERPPEGVDVERVRIRGRWSCDPPPGVSVSQPTRPMAAWILRPEVVPPKRARVKLAETEQ